MTVQQAFAPGPALAPSAGVAAAAAFDWSTLLQDAPFAVVVFEGPDHRVVFSNRRHDELTADRMTVGRTLAETVPELAGQPLVQALDRVYATGTPESMHEVSGCLVRHGVLQEAWLDVTWQPIRDRSGAVVGVLATSIDVTPHVRARYRQELHKEQELRDELLAIASHELRTPLTALQLQLQAALRRLERAGLTDDAGLEHKLEVARRQTDRLTMLVDGLLDATRISLGRLSLERGAFDMAELARAIVERHAAQARAAACPVALEAGVPVIGCWDRPRMEQAVAHLLTNAIKYGAGRPIAVRVEGDGVSGRVTVQDHGLGIPAEDLDRIFGRFERAVSSRHYGGLGLGLYVAQQIVQAHGGAIEVTSEPGHGATFTVAVPRWPDTRRFEEGTTG